MAIPQALLDKISEAEKGEYSSSEILDAISKSENFTDVASKVTEFRKHYGDDKILARLKSTPIGQQQTVEDQTGITQTARENPNLYGAYGAGKTLVSQAVKPALETVGAVVGAPAGAIVGSSLGYGMGKKIGEMAERGYSALGEWMGLEKPSKDKPQSLVDSAISETGKSAVDVGSSMALGKGMDVAGKALYPLESKIGQTVREAFQKAVKPTVAGKGNAAQIENYYSGAERAVKSIIKNPDVENPKTMDEFSRAIKDTKVSIYGQYNDIAKQAGKDGIQVDLGSTINEMKSIGGSPKLRRVNPSEGDKLLSMAEEWEKHPTRISPEEAENLISELNTLSKSWWKNPNSNDVTSAINYERIARNVRESLTQAIGSQEGAEYNALKKAYGDLTSIEKEVTNRALVYGRRNPHGFFDLANIHGTAEFVYGLANMNPAAMAAGAATKGAVKYYKWIDSPDHRIKSMFETVQDKMVKAGEISPPTEKNPFFLRGGKPENFVGENGNYYPPESSFNPYSPKVDQYRSPQPKSPEQSLGGIERGPSEVPGEIQKKSLTYTAQSVANKAEDKIGRPLTRREFEVLKEADRRDLSKTLDDIVRNARRR